MPRQKEYWNLYADHCIRHPKDAVTYITFRQRVLKRGPKLAIRLGKRQSAPEMAKIHEEKRNGFLRQKRAEKAKQNANMAIRILL